MVMDTMPSAAVANGRFFALALVAASVLWLPFGLYLLSAAYVLRQLLYFRRSSLASIAALRQGSHHQRSLRTAPPTVLVTGLGTTQGLFVARALWKAGCRVVGADETPACRLPIPYRWPLIHLRPPGALSTAVRRFYNLPSARARASIGPTRSNLNELERALLQIVETEKVAYWIDCCSSNHDFAARVDAATTIATHTTCQPLTFDESVARKLRTPHVAFRWLGDKLGLQVPQTHTVRSRDQVHRVLSAKLHEQDTGKAPTPYLLRPLPHEDEAERDDEVERDEAVKQNTSKLVRLPKRTVSETYETLSRLKVNSDTPYALVQDLVGRRYQTVALIGRNQVRAFVACEYPPPNALFGGLKALPSDSAVWTAMLKYNQSFASRCSLHLRGNVTFDFAVEERATEAGTTGTLYATAVRAGLGPSVALFSGQERELAECYLSIGRAGKGITNGVDTPSDASVLVPAKRVGLFWIGNDVLRLIATLIGLLFWRSSPRDSVAKVELFWQRLLSQRWVEAAMAVEDPLPAFWTYNVYWPLRLIGKVWSGRKWGGVDLSEGTWAI